MVSILKTDKIQASHGSTIEIPTGHTLHHPGSVIQFQHVNFTNNVSVSSSTFTDIPVEQ